MFKEHSVPIQTPGIPIPCTQAAAAVPWVHVGDTLVPSLTGHVCHWWGMHSVHDWHPPLMTGILFITGTPLMTAWSLSNPAALCLAGASEESDGREPASLGHMERLQTIA